MILKVKERIQLFITITFFLALLFVIGRMGSLEIDNITIGQAVVSCSIALVYMFIAAITYMKLGKEKRIEDTGKTESSGHSKKW